MPYITQERRNDLADTYSERDIIKTPGELNYKLTELCIEYLDTPSYQDYNDVIGALEACKLEFYRRLVSPYEDKKIEENGDVY